MAYKQVTTSSHHNIKVRVLKMNLCITVDKKWKNGAINNVRIPVDAPLPLRLKSIFFLKILKEGSSHPC